MWHIKSSTRVLAVVAMIAISYIIGAIVAGATVFEVGYGCCHVVARITGDKEYMNYMWVVMAIEPASLLIGGLIGCWCGVLLLNARKL
jgi:hypothetical protein